MNNRCGVLAAAAVVVMLLSGCAGHPGGAQRGARLSDAARQVRGESVVIPPTGYSHGAGALHVEREVAAQASLDATFNAMMVNYGRSHEGFGLEYSRIQYANSALQEGEFFAFFSEHFNEEQVATFGYRLVYGDYTLPAHGIAGDAIETAFSWGADTFVKIYGPDFSFFTAPYLLVSLGYGELNWRYRRPIVDSSGNYFLDDSLEYFELRAGLGGELGRYSGLQLSAYAGPVKRVYLGWTREGFNNDLFEDSLDMIWGATIGVRF